MRVRPNTEKAAAESLRLAGLEEFLPLARTRRQWSDRIKSLDIPLFPGYLFCRTSLDIPYRIVETPGVVGFVGFHGRPEPIPVSEIEAVKRLLDANRRLRAMALLRAGQPIEVRDGPLAGLRGVLARIKNENHLIVNLHLLQRSVAVTLEGDAVIPYA